MLFNYIKKRIYNNFLIIFLYIIVYESYYYGENISKCNYRSIHLNVKTEPKYLLHFIKNNLNKITNKKYFGQKLIGKSRRKNNGKTKLFSIQITNQFDNSIPEEYIKNNIPSEPIYPYISIPDNLYTKEKNVEEEKKEEGEYKEEYINMRKITYEEFKKLVYEKAKKTKQLPNPTIGDYIEDVNYKKYVHPSLIKNVDENTQKYVNYSLIKNINKNKQINVLNSFDENDVDNDLTEYDAAFKGIGPWPSTEELKNKNDFFEFDKTDLEMEYNITYDKSRYHEYMEKEIKRNEKEGFNKGMDYLVNEETENNDTYIEEQHSSDNVKENEDELSDGIDKNIIKKEKHLKLNIPNNISVSQIRKLYYKKEIKTIKEAKEEMVKWNERKSVSRNKWILTNEEIDLLPAHFKNLYLEKRKEYEKKEKDISSKCLDNSVGGQVFFDFSERNEMKKEEEEEKEVEQNLENNSIENVNDTKENYEDDSDNMLQNFRLLEDNVLYSKPKSPIENILYEWDDPLNCKWRRRAEEVIRDVIMYDYPFKELRRPSNLDLYDITWYPGKLDVFITTEEEKNYKITLFDLKQLVKKIAERLKELEIDEEIFILPFFELIVSSLPNKNILVCRKDWNNNIGKEVVVFFKNNEFYPIEGILLGSPSAFHVILNIDDEHIENIFINNIDKIVLKNVKSDLKENIMLKVEIDTNEKKENEVDSKDHLDKDIEKKIKITDEEKKATEFVEQDNKEIEDIKFDELDKLKKIDKTLKNKNEDIIKNISNVDDGDNSNLINSFVDEEDDEEDDEEISSYENEHDDYIPDE